MLFLYSYKVGGSIYQVIKLDMQQTPRLMRAQESVVMFSQVPMRREEESTQQVSSEQF